jgi:hypothetical protein
MHKDADSTPPKATESIRLPARMPRSCGFVRINAAGALELELYDHGDMAHSLFGNDVSTFYTVPASQWPVLTAGLQQRQAAADTLPRRAAQVDWTDTRTAELPNRVADSFLKIDEFLHWLTSSDVAFHTHTDSWV